MIVTVVWRNKRYDIDAATIAEALAALGLQPETYLVLRDGVLLDADDELHPGDTLQLIGVIAGG